MRILPRRIAATTVGTIASMVASAVVGAATNNTQITIPLRCGGLAFDPTSHFFYASAGSNTAGFSNCLLRIEPFSGAATLVANLDSEPGMIAVSARQRALYVAIPAQNAARRYDLAAGALGPSFNIGGEASQLLVLAGIAERVAVIRKNSLTLGVYENGTELSPASGYDHVSRLAGNEDGSQLYGYNLNSTAYTFHRFGVGPTGVRLLDQSDNLFPLPGASMSVAGGRLYAGDGWVADPEAKTLLGRFAGIGVPSGSIALGHVAPDLALNRVFFVRPEWPDSPIFAGDPNSFRILNSGVISNTTWSGNITSDRAYIHDFQRWGEDGFACRTYDKVIISRSRLVPIGAPRDLGVFLRSTESVVTNGQVYSYEITCTNSGPLVASNAVLQFCLPPETTFVSATNSRGTLSVSSNLVTCPMSTLPLQVAATVRVTVRVQTTNVAALVATAGFSSPAVDLNEDNNFAALLTTANWRTGEEQFNRFSSIAPSDVVYSAQTRRLNLIFDSNAGKLAQMLVRFDPLLGAFETPILLPGNPMKAAISADGNWLEVAMQSAGEVRRVRLATGEIALLNSRPRWQEIQAKSETEKVQAGIRFTSTQAADVTSNEVMGAFPFVLFHYHLFEPDVSTRRFFQFVHDLAFVPSRLRVFETDGFRLLSDVVLPVPAWDYSGLSRWGENGLLLRSRQGMIIWRSRFVPYGAGCDLEARIFSAPAEVRTNGSFVLRATLANAGPNPATNALLQLDLPPAATLVDVSASEGALSRNGSVLTLSMDRLVPSGSASITATLRASNAAVVVTRAVASSRNFDATWTNDVANCSTVVSNDNGWPETDTAVIVSLTVDDLIYEPVSGRLLASISSASGAYGNCVVAIDPADGHLRGHWFVGSDPGRLAVSDDGQFLYISLKGAEAIARLRLSDGVIDQRFSVGLWPDLNEYAKELLVQPGHPETIALLRARQGITPSTSELVLYRNGLQLPLSLDAFDIQYIQFNETGDRCFGYGNEVSDFPFSTIKVATNGVTMVDRFSGLLAGFGETFTYEAGLVFGTGGIVFDPITRMPRGWLPGVSRFAGLVPHAAAGRAYGLTADGDSAVLRSYELRDMTVLSKQSYSAATDSPVGLQRSGPGRLAYHTASSVVLLRSSQIPAGPAADLQVRFDGAPAWAKLNQPFSVELLLTNAGPNSCENGVVTVRLSEGLSLISASSESVVEGRSGHEFQPRFLTAGQSVRWSLVLVGTNTVLKTVQASVRADITDPRVDNDAATCWIPMGQELDLGNVDRLPVAVRSLVYSSVRGRLYAATPAGAPLHGNCIFEIDPATSQVRGPLPVGSEPVALAVTDDGKSLYVSLVGMGAMRRVDLDRWSIDPIFPVGPGVADAVSVATSSSGIVMTHGSDAAVFVGGTRVATVAGSISRLLRGSGSRIYGFKPELGSMPVLKLNATPSSINVQGQWNAGLPGVDLRFANGRLFSNHGHVMEPEAQQITGRYSEFTPVDAFAPEFDGSRLYTLQGDLLQTWETTSYTAGTATNVGGPGSRTRSLLRWGADGLAVLMDDVPVWFRTPLVRTGPGSDSDRDGMPDSWELAYALNPNIGSATVDSDWDGVTDIDEYRQGRNPQFAEGPLRAIARRSSHTELTVRFAGRLGRSYRIEHTGTLAPPDWQPLSNDVLGSGKMISFTYPLSAPRGFLRVVEKP